MNEHPLLIENEKKRLTVKLPLLLCFAMWAVWQMGVLYFSGTSLSVYGQTPLPMNTDDFTMIIALGYIASIAFLAIVPYFVVWAERISAAVALAAAALMFVPLAPDTLSMLFYIHAFCCVFMIGFESALIINLFKEKTAIVYITLAYSIAFLLVAVLQNDIVKVPFEFFLVFTIAALILMQVFFFRLPSKKESWPCYVKRSDGLKPSRKMFVGVFILIILCATTFMGSAFAETVSSGISVYYAGFAIAGLVVYGLWKRFGISPLRSVRITIAMNVVGFVLVILSPHVPAVNLIACALLGGGFMALCLAPFFALFLAKQYPSRFITPGMVTIGFVMIMLQTVLLEAFRDSMQVLYIIYLVMSVVLTIMYLMLEPFMLWQFSGKTLITGEEAAALNEAARAGVLADDSRTEKEMPAAVAGLDRIREISLDDLTPRERQVAQELMSGYNYSQIGERLHISTDTVNTHRKRIYSKLDVHNVPELIVKMQKLSGGADETQPKGGESK